MGEKKLSVSLKSDNAVATQNQHFMTGKERKKTAEER